MTYLASAYTAIAAVGDAAADAAATAAAAAAAAAPTVAATGSVLAYASTAAAVLGAAGTAYASHESGVAQKADSAMRSRQAGLEAGQKQISIRQNMLKALASQNAAAGAAGVGTGGSIGANVNRQITQNKSDLLGLSADTSAIQSQYAAQGNNAETTGNIKAGASLLDAGAAAVKGSG